TQGLPHLVTRFHATASAEGRLAADRMAEPSRYSATYDLRKRHDRRVSMQFVRRPGGKFAERGTDDTGRKRPPAESCPHDPHDPLAAPERIRELVRTASPSTPFSIPVYDGARRFDIVGRMLPKGNPVDRTLRAELTLRPIAGFRGETSEDGDPDDAPRKVQLTATDDEKMVPLSIRVPVFYMPLLVQFQRLCAASDPCSG